MLQSRPYWKYIHNDTVAHPRPLHQSWNGTVLRYDDPWWQTHFTPNGFGCRCRIAAVGADQYKGHPAPDDGTYTKTDRFGTVHTLPRGIDYGWDTAPGAKTEVSLRTLVQDKLIRYKPAITKALSRDVSRYINAHTDIVKFVNNGLKNKTLQEILWLGFVEDVEKVKAAVDTDVSGYLVLLPSDAINHIENHHRFDGNGQRQVTPEDYQHLQDILTNGDVRAGDDSAMGFKRIIVSNVINGELFRAVFEIHDGKARDLRLVALNIRT